MRGQRCENDGVFKEIRDDGIARLYQGLTGGSGGVAGAWAWSHKRRPLLKTLKSMAFILVCWKEFEIKK